MTTKKILLPIFISFLMGCSQAGLDGFDGRSLMAISSSMPISCKFEKINNQNKLNENSFWYLFRKENRVESRDERTQQGQVWEKDSKGKITMTHLFYKEKVALEYSSGDLAATGKDIDWNKVWSVINPEKLPKDFSLNKSETIKGVRRISYSSPLGTVVWLPDLLVPAEISVSEEGGYSEHLILKSCEPMQVAKLAYGPTTDIELRQYRHLDFSDLGDMETDPQVKKIEALMGGHEHH